MEYQIQYWRDPFISTLLSGDIITSKELLKLIESKKCNIMIRHTATSKYSVCWLDKGKFKQM